MTDEQIAAWQKVADECPRRRDRYEHQAGCWEHWQGADGVVRCLGRGSHVWEGARPTDAQEAAWKATTLAPGGD